MYPGRWLGTEMKADILFHQSVNVFHWCQNLFPGRRSEELSECSFVWLNVGVGYPAPPPRVPYLCHHKEGWTVGCGAALKNSVLLNFLKSLCDNILQYSREQSKPLGSGNLKNPTPRGLQSLWSVPKDCWALETGKSDDPPTKWIQDTQHPHQVTRTCWPHQWSVFLGLQEAGRCLMWAFCSTYTCWGKGLPEEISDAGSAPQWPSAPEDTAGLVSQPHVPALPMRMCMCWVKATSCSWQNLHGQRETWTLSSQFTSPTTEGERGQTVIFFLLNVKFWKDLIVNGVAYLPI